MIDCEPKIRVALLQGSPEARLKLEGSFFLPDGRAVIGELTVRAVNGQIILSDSRNREIAHLEEILLTPNETLDTFFTVHDVKIGIDFHWQRSQNNPSTAHCF